MLFIVYEDPNSQPKEKSYSHDNNLVASSVEVNTGDKENKFDK